MARAAFVAPDECILLVGAPDGWVELDAADMAMDGELGTLFERCVARVTPTYDPRARVFAEEVPESAWGLVALALTLAAVAGLARTAGSNKVFELFAHYGCRDFRSIGHKIIFVGNAFRALDVMGWHHAEPVFRHAWGHDRAAERAAHRMPARSDRAIDQPVKTYRLGNMMVAFGNAIVAFSHHA